MKTNYEIRYAAHPEDAKVMIQQEFAERFLNRKDICPQ